MNLPNQFPTRLICNHGRNIGPFRKFIWQVGKVPTEQMLEKPKMADNNKSSGQDGGKSSNSGSKSSTPARDEDGRFTEKSDDKSSKSGTQASGSKSSSSKSR